MKPKFRWFLLGPREAVQTIFAFGSRRYMDESPSDAARPPPGGFALGVAGELSNAVSLVVLRQDEALETLGWVATYTPEAFPLSQSIRVLSGEDLEKAESFLGTSRVFPREVLWPSIVLGEMLALGDAGLDADKVPISRALACFSFAMGRTALLYGDAGAVTLSSLSRLRLVEQDRLFLPRPLPIDDLEKIWGFADERLAQNIEVRRIVNAVTSTIDVGSSGLFGEMPKDYALLQLDVDAISSGPIEQRVMEFERVSTRLIVLGDGNKELFERTSLHLASFAFWVGGGTTHLSLLDEFGVRFPAVYAWTGLLAATAGQDRWDSKWFRGVSAVEKLLRAPFALEDPPSADLSWLEYEWIHQQKVPLEWVRDIPKFAIRALTVEVVPGAICQMRLSDTKSSSGHSQEKVPSKNRTEQMAPPKIQQEIASKDQVLKSIDQAMASLREALALVRGNGGAVAQIEQPTLFAKEGLSNSDIRAPKKRASGKNYKYSR